MIYWLPIFILSAVFRVLSCVTCFYPDKCKYYPVILPIRKHEAQNLSAFLYFKILVN